ncbi:MAG: DUF3857 domain-containing protein, partial [Flavisolibacter sp.]|nr:DUF3857 domain-containing protein [Flavisolibacter sp.]
MKKLTAVLSALYLCLFSFANDFDNVWDALNHNKIKEAEALLQKAKKNPATAFDAYLTELYIRTFNGKEDYLEGFIETLAQQKDKNEYLYALWFNGTALGNYGKKTKPHQLKLLNSILTDNTYNGSIQCAAHYVRAMHYQFSNEAAKARQEWQAMGALENWQLTGPFENISGTGFNAQPGPVTTPDGGALFKAKNNIDVSWFTPAKMNREGWTFTGSHIPDGTAVVYAQTFVYAPSDLSVVLNAGGNGSLKVWVNDELLLAESKERTTELDYYKNKCKLNKGYNRVLVQLGYVDNDRPNFIIRFTDANFNTLKELTSTAVVQPYIRSNNKGTPLSEAHFAEAYFQKKIAAEPRNLINYILLSQTYLRCSRTTEAREIIQKALAKAPENVLLRFELLQCFIKAGNRTLLMQEMERLKESSPESFIVYRINIQKLMDEEKYEEAAEKLTKMVSLYGEDETTIETKITILARQNKMEELLKTIESAYKKFPENVTFLQLMYRVKKEVAKDAKGALGLYEKYLKTNYNFSLINQLAGEYKSMGMNDKQFSIIKSLYEDAGYDPRFSGNLSDYYFQKQNYGKALEYAEEALQLAPYVGRYWKNKAVIQEQMNKKEEAINSYKKALYYDRSNYDARKKLNALEQKQDLYKMLPQSDVYEIIKKAPATNKEDNYMYLLDEKSAILYDAGALEEYVTTVVKLYNQKGIDAWKEYYVSYNSNNQNLLIEKSEAVKPNGTKVPAEQNDDAIIFTGLEPGDAIVIKYRIQNYAQGRMSREYWDKFIFNSTVPCQASRYTLIAPKDFLFHTEITGGNVKPDVQEKGDYKQYTWEMKDMPALK